MSRHNGEVEEVEEAFEVVDMEDKLDYDNKVCNQFCVIPV